MGFLRFTLDSPVARIPAAERGLMFVRTSKKIPFLRIWERNVIQVQSRLECTWQVSVIKRNVGELVALGGTGEVHW